MNQITIAGHLGADPEARFTASGRKVTALRVAARVRRKGKTIWWRVSVWGEQFDKMMPYFKKGSPIIVTGDLEEPEIFTDRQGNAQVSMRMTGLDLLFSPFGRPDGGLTEAPGLAEAPAEREESTVQTEEQALPAVDDEEVPF